MGRLYTLSINSYSFCFPHFCNPLLDVKSFQWMILGILGAVVSGIALFYVLPQIAMLYDSLGAEWTGKTKAARYFTLLFLAGITCAFPGQYIYLKKKKPISQKSWNVFCIAYFSLHLLGIYIFLLNPIKELAAK